MPKLFRFLMITCFVFFGFTLVSALITDTASAAFPSCCYSSSSPYCDGGDCLSLTCTSAGLQCGIHRNSVYGLYLNCGNCPSGQICNSSGKCINSCTPNCSNKQCGSNGCNGSCGTCSNVPNASVSCSTQQQCTYTCNTGYANCDNNWGNGCEVNTNTDTNNCGRCGNKCGTGSTCENGTCKEPEKKCADTDKDDSDPTKWMVNGDYYINQYKKGTTTSKIANDTCASLPGAASCTDYCANSNNSVVEFYCNEDGSSGRQIIDCPYGCVEKDGACLYNYPYNTCSPTYDNCANGYECDKATYRCVKPGTCSDTDAGGAFQVENGKLIMGYINYYKKGTAKNKFGSRSITDTCVNGTLVESYCKNNELETQAVTCPKGCAKDGGSCNQENKCVDTDVDSHHPDGNNPYVSGSAKGKNGKTLKDSYDPKTGTLGEAVCDENGNAKKLYQICPAGGDKKGVCVPCPQNNAGPLNNNDGLSPVSKPKQCETEPKKCTSANEKEVCGDCSYCSVQGQNNKAHIIILTLEEACEPCMKLKGQIASSGIEGQYSDILKDGHFEYVNPMKTGRDKLLEMDAYYKTNIFGSTTSYPAVFIATIENGVPLAGSLKQIYGLSAIEISLREFKSKNYTTSIEGICLPKPDVSDPAYGNCTDKGTPGKCLNGECKPKKDANCSDFVKWSINIINKAMQEGKNPPLNPANLKKNLIDKNLKMCSKWNWPLYNYVIDCGTTCPKCHTCNDVEGNPDYGFCMPNSTSSLNKQICKIKMDIPRPLKDCVCSNVNGPVCENEVNKKCNKNPRCTENTANSCSTDNFTVQTQSNCCDYARALEYNRCKLAVELTGSPLGTSTSFPNGANWGAPAVTTINVNPALGAGGATTFSFDNGQVGGWRMDIQGSHERLIDSVIPHEVQHMVTATTLGRPIPRWLDEGISQLQEIKQEKCQHYNNLLQFSNANRTIPFNTLLLMTEYPSDVIPLYAQGESMTDYLVRLGGGGCLGDRKFLDFIRRAYAVGDWTTALRETYGINSIDEFQRKWVDYASGKCNPCNCKDPKFDSGGSNSPTSDINGGKSWLSSISSYLENQINNWTGFIKAALIR